jgi:hypothetical protein
VPLSKPVNFLCEPITVVHCCKPAELYLLIKAFSSFAPFHSQWSISGEMLPVINISPEAFTAAAAPLSIPLMPLVQKDFMIIYW